jgi:hypothetical protein
LGPTLTKAFANAEDRSGSSADKTLDVLRAQV